MERLTINTSLRTSSQGDCRTLSLRGDLDVASAPMLERAIAGMCAAGATEIVLDLGGVEFMDSSGLNAILRGRMLCDEHRCQFSLMPARRSVHRVFEIARLLEKLPFHKSAHSPSEPAQSPGRSGELEIRDDAQAGRHTLVLTGQLDTTTSPALEKVMVTLCRAGASEIILDLRRLDLLDSSGVRAIVAGQERCREHACQFFLTPGRQAIERLFDVVGLPHDAPAPEERSSNAI
ncbi:MAG TPA: anti-sigma factor antagonist [Solirubrobacteraceae bacterium]|jgi:anti-anti-sigma factor